MADEIRFTKSERDHDKLRSKQVSSLIQNTKDFLGILSKVSRGSVQEKLQWIFGLYDLNGDGLITKNEMLDVVTSIYEMLGRSTEPVVEEHSAKEHVEKIFHVRNLSTSTKCYLKNDVRNSKLTRVTKRDETRKTSATNTASESGS
ncbi:hypothetical protein ANN_02760 [Periplaneta americana]|uniref:EF-hand domain-containing protein n=1 Tax=Periplaneta americana TaxID=6978 RepID=A0ABQ8TX78_PERAM|nr:hypothetical protein ANN_02760 [Periplaneta americana]